ncbi:hypothetical protein AB0F49_01000 [Micromonospora ureilytica]|uniref:hypothetical protein n=1 Tax=Micromonospora ureilytica TaxID=709868 RepID=UPI0033FF086A
MDEDRRSARAASPHCRQHVRKRDSQACAGAPVAGWRAAAGRWRAAGGWRLAGGWWAADGWAADGGPAAVEMGGERWGAVAAGERRR